MILNMKNNLKSLYLNKKYKTLIHYLNAYDQDFSFSVISEERPYVQFNGKKFFGFKNASIDETIYRFLRKYFPLSMTEDKYRISRDIITRYIFPHMMPVIKPLTSGHGSMSGFHGQHKDAIPDIKDIKLRDRLNDIFTVRHDDVILNCGAYIGYGDMRVADLIPDGKIYAVEAKKECHHLLQENIKINNLSNVIPLHNAIWNKSEIIDLNTGELQTNSLVHESDHFEPETREKDKESVQATSVDELVQSQGLDKVDFISLTLNGAEVEALDGMKDVLDNYGPRIRLAGWYKRGEDYVADLCAKKLERFGYKVVIGNHRSVYGFRSC